jgi:hypothetical protein
MTLYLLDEGGVSRLSWRILAAVIVATVCREGQAQTPRMTDICYRATHNSYSRGLRLNAQIDDYNIWEVEIDFGRNSGHDFEVGHDDPGGEVDVSPAMPSLLLRDWLQNVKDSASWHFHPIALKLEKKGWMSRANWQADLRDLLTSVLGAENIMTKSEFENRYHSQWPAVGELVGKFFVMLLNAQGDDGFFFVGKDPPGLPGLCVAFGEYGSGDHAGFVQGLRSGCGGSPTNRIVMDDAFLKEWSNWGVHPPLPAYVDPGNDGYMWGTRAFPFKRIGYAVNANRSPTGVATQGYLVVPAGTYPEKMTISTPMTITSSGGTVTIGGSIVCYTITLVFQNVHEAGTRDPVYATLHGTGGSSAEYLLTDSPARDFDQGEAHTIWRIGGVGGYDDIGRLQSVTIRIGGDNDIALDDIIVDSATTGRYFINANRWVGTDPGHNNPETFYVP